MMEKFKLERIKDSITNNKKKNENENPPKLSHLKIIISPLTT